MSTKQCCRTKRSGQPQVCQSCTTRLYQRWFARGNGSNTGTWWRNNLFLVPSCPTPVLPACQSTVPRGAGYTTLYRLSNLIQLDADTHRVDGSRHYRRLPGLCAAIRWPQDSNAKLVAASALSKQQSRKSIACICVRDKRSLACLLRKEAGTEILQSAVTSAADSA